MGPEYSNYAVFSSKKCCDFEKLQVVTPVVSFQKNVVVLKKHRTVAPTADGVSPDSQRPFGRPLRDFGALNHLGSWHQALLARRRTG